MTSTAWFLIALYTLALGVVAYMAIRRGPVAQSNLWLQTEAPFWWPNAQGFAIAAIIFICATALFYRMHAQSNIDDKMLDTMITVIYTTCLVSVFNFLFGSSRGSAAKDETQNRIVERALAGPAVVIPPTPTQLGEATLKNGELTYFRTLVDDDARTRFLAMTPAERAVEMNK